MTTTATPPTPQPTPARTPSVPRPDKLPSEVLIEHGWRQFARHDLQGRLCYMGAAAAALTYADVVGFSDATLAVLTERGWKGDYIPSWNDDKRTTFDDVIAVAREAERRLGWRDDEVPA